MSFPMPALIDGDENASSQVLNVLQETLEAENPLDPPPPPLKRKAFTALASDDDPSGHSPSQVPIAPVIVDGVELSPLGLNNMPKLQSTGQYPEGPKLKDCKTCGEPIDWRTTGHRLRLKIRTSY